MRLCTLRRSAATTSSTPSTSWRGLCPSHPSEAHLGATKHLLRYLAGSADSSITYKQGGSNSRPFPTRTGEQTPTTGSLHHHIHPNSFQRPDQLQGGHSKINCTIYNGGRIGGGGDHHEGSSLLQQYDAGARLQGKVRQRAASHRQRIGTSRRRQPPHSREAHRAEVLLCAGINGEG